ncbi:response regulator transcription factor [Azospirillum doebereinerae]|uniref:Response regulator transcription factor n=1 Tax=Azospirillum doebereinerae TaxID=92933 RepID=A0A433J1V0_9PROT|nr:response regulator transcription factor [Azospirillum doebereinerae]MCG5241986.1 response regulator transcription factor [Azospirillum doebereinerae]RUQ65062.1 response regulator transcription factor [Azospirillum doebereinerae]
MHASVLVLDDRPVIRAGCRVLLAEAGFGPVQEAEHGEPGLSRWRRDRPAATVIGLPDQDGFETAQAILAEDPATAVVLFGAGTDPALAARALRAGVRGCVGDRDPAGTLAAAVESALAGTVFLGPRLAQALALQALLPAADPLALLTRREREILAQIGHGRTAAVIAGALGLSHKTVANVCTQIKDKLGADSPRALIRIAIEAGLAG